MSNQFETPLNHRPKSHEQDTGRVPDVGSVLELDPALVLTPESNPCIPLESVTGLLESIRAHTQLVIGIVAPHPEKPGYWLCLDGNRRLLVCRILGIPFKAVEHHGKVSPGSLAATRIAANRTRRQMTDDELAADLEIIIAEKGCTQEEAALQNGVSASEASKSRTFGKRAIQEVKDAVANHTIVRDIGRAISTLLPEQQKTLLERAVRLNMCSDAVERLAKEMRGKAPRKRVLKLQAWGATIAAPNPTLENLESLANALLQAIKRLVKEGASIELLPSVLAAVTKT